MMQSLQILIKYLRKKYKIFSYNVLGHSDIAPLRKQDPGKSFPWYKLNKFLENKIWRDNLCYDEMLDPKWVLFIGKEFWNSGNWNK